MACQEVSPTPSLPEYCQIELLRPSSLFSFNPFRCCYSLGMERFVKLLWTLTASTRPHVVVSLSHHHKLPRVITIFFFPYGIIISPLIYRIVKRYSSHFFFFNHQLGTVVCFSVQQPLFTRLLSPTSLSRSSTHQLSSAFVMRAVISWFTIPLLSI